jgi:tripartite-type tricarboxylate transporter receptor subunit TctC
MAAAIRTANEPSVKEGMEKLALGYSVADGEVFKRQIAADSAQFRQLIEQLNLKN